MQPVQPVDELVRQLYLPDGKVEYLFTMNKYGPVFRNSPAMERLIKHGHAVQARLLPELKDPRIRNEIAFVLAEIGDQDVLPHLIEVLPTTAKLTKEESFSVMCLLSVLGKLTGAGCGDYENYTPECRQGWKARYESCNDYLFAVAKPTQFPWARIQIDVEAKMAGQATSAYREEHPWIAYDDIKVWRDDPAYQLQLKNYCFSVILNSSWHPHAYVDWRAHQALGRIRDPRALAAVHKLCTYAKDLDDCHSLMPALGERGDPSSIPVLEALARSNKVTEEPHRYEEYRVEAIERIQLLRKHGDKLKGKPFDAPQQIDFMRCLEDPAGMDHFVAELRDLNNDWYLSRKLRVASYLNNESVLSCLKEMAADMSRSDSSRTLVHGALARLGEKDSIDQLKLALGHKQPPVRLAAAEALWHLGNRDGVKALTDLLELRPIESGTEGVETGGEYIVKVTALNGTNLEYIRSACRIVGEIGDRSAIEPLKRLLPLNLNGTVATGGSGFGWGRRPDVVALARMGDFSGIEVLRASISKGDPLGAVDDFVEIGLRQYIPQLLPMLDPAVRKQVEAAEAILLLFENGR
jgi:HEAT repeat protein